MLNRGIPNDRVRSVELVRPKVDWEESSRQVVERKHYTPSALFYDQSPTSSSLLARTGIASNVATLGGIECNRDFATGSSRKGRESQVGKAVAFGKAGCLS